jgi:hypothetical protein
VLAAVGLAGDDDTRGYVGDADGRLGLVDVLPAGAGGTVFYVDNPDSDLPGAPVRQCFYTNLAGYTSNAAVFNTTVLVNTPLTTDTNGVIFFGFRVPEGHAAVWTAY